MRARGAGGKGRATDLRTGRGPVALGVLPLVPSLPVPAIPCHSLLYPCPNAWALPHLPLQFCPVSRDFPQSACRNSSSTSSGRRRSSWEGGWYWDALQLPLCPLPGVVTLHLRRGDEMEICLCRLVQADPRSSRLASIAALLPTYICKRYVPGSQVSQVSLHSPAVIGLQLSVQHSPLHRRDLVCSFSAPPHTVSASHAASLPAIIVFTDTIAETG